MQLMPRSLAILRPAFIPKRLSGQMWVEMANLPVGYRVDDFSADENLIQHSLEEKSSAWSELWRVRLSLRAGKLFKLLDMRKVGTFRRKIGVFRSERVNS